ncbi:hypothetical protein [Azospirillum isscasi]|nr:hypothetical protein [Azospirillum isscasi]
MPNLARQTADETAEETAEADASPAPVTESRADRHGVPHERMRVWLLRVADGRFDGEPPEACDP